MTTALLNTKIVEVENKIADVISLVKKKNIDEKNIVRLLIIINLQVKYLNLR